MGPADMEKTIKLVERVKIGDTRAFWDLMSIYEEMIFRFCYRKLLVKEAAEDAAQKAFDKAFDKIRDLRDNEKFKTWLFSIARNICIDELRRINKLVDLPGDNGVNSMPNGKESPEEILGKEQRKKMVKEEVGRLGDIYKDVVLLVHYEELSYEEAAEVLGIPVGTVRSRLSRGMEELKERLKDIRG